MTVNEHEQNAMRKLTALLICACIAISAAFAQTRQQALDEINRIEKMIPFMLSQAWEAARTQSYTVIYTPYGTVTIKFDLDEYIKETYTGNDLTYNLRTLHGIYQGNVIRINCGAYDHVTLEGLKRTVTHELGHHMDKRTGLKVLEKSKYMTVEDYTEIEADAFAMRHLGKSSLFEFYEYLKKSGLIRQNYIDAVINRAEEMEYEERENLARLRTIANAPETAPPPPVKKPSVNPAQTLADSAIAAFGRKDYDKAIADYTKAISIDPKFATAYSNRGSAYAMRCDYDKAIADYTKAMELNPGIMYLYLNRGSAYAEKGDYDKAMADYNQQIKIDPNDALAYTGRGNMYYKKNDLYKAIAEHNHAIRLDPNLAIAYNNRGNVYDEMRDYDRAIADYNKAIQLDPNLAETYSNRGISYQKKDDHDRAMADFNQAIRLNPNLAIAYIRRGMTYFVKGDLDKAIADYTKAIRLTPNDPDPYQLRGMVYFHKDDIDRTIADYEAALRLNPNNGEVKNILEMVRQIKRMMK